MKLTVDTNFLVSATQWDYSVSHKLLVRLIEKDVEIFTTHKILEEFSEVLVRDFEYTSEELSNVIRIVLSFVSSIETVSEIDIVKEDPDDNKIIACAVDSNSDFIITYDPHLLRLKRHKGIGIITPEEARTLF